MKIIACIEDPVIIEKILNHLKAKEANQTGIAGCCADSGGKAGMAANKAGEFGTLKS